MLFLIGLIVSPFFKWLGNLPTLYFFGRIARITILILALELFGFSLCLIIGGFLFAGIFLGEFFLDFHQWWNQDDNDYKRSFMKKSHILFRRFSSRPIRIFN